MSERKIVTIDEIASFCEIKDCRVTLGDPEIGSITIDGMGAERKFNNYRRFLALNELSRLPDPRQVVRKATIFKVITPSGEKKLTREEFEQELRKFQELMGV